MKKCDYRPASLKHRVTLQAKSTASDGQGGYSDSWASLATLWAAVEPLKGWERMQAMQLASPTTHKLLMRYRAMTTAQRLVFRGRVLDIKEIINEGEANRWLRVMCVETGELVEIADLLSPGGFTLEDGASFLFQDGTQFQFQATA